MARVEGAGGAEGGRGRPGALWQRLARVFARRDPGVRADAERILLEADFGVAATEEILAHVERVSDGDLQGALEQAVTRALAAAASAGDSLARASQPPTVILVYGVNGVGKTTTIAKLARRLEREGRSVLLAAADTFRAGAGEQIRIWAARLGVPCVGGTGDPAAVVFDAIAAARARGIDTVLVDTAGRLHTEERLLEELKKIVRVVAKQQAGAPHESLLVLDGTLGQNAVHQALAFASTVPLTGLIVTKLDGTAKGGSVVAIERALAGARGAVGAVGPLPIRFIGMGEGLADLEAFDAARFARRLVSG
jgi:fused signal recognition particle receptor